MLFSAVYSEEYAELKKKKKEVILKLYSKGIYLCFKTLYKYVWDLFYFQKRLKPDVILGSKIISASWVEW